MLRIRGFGEIRSGYDARAIGNSMAIIDSSIYARATPESDFAKSLLPGGCCPTRIFDRIDRGVARASKIKPQDCQIQVIGAGVVATSIRSKNLRMRSICVPNWTLRVLEQTHTYA